MKLEDELLLIQQAKAGNLSAQAALLEKYDRFLWKCAMKRAPRPDDIEDFKQQAAIYLLEAIQRFDPASGSKPITYFYACVPNRLLRDYHRSGIIQLPTDKQYRDKVSFSVTSLDAAFSDDSGSFLDSIGQDSGMFAGFETADATTSIHKAIKQLSEREQVIVSRRLSGETMQEIADDFGLSKARVGQLEQRAHRQLKVLLSDVSRIDLPRQPKKKWTEAEVLYLSKNHRKKPIADIADAIGRGKCAVIPKITELGLAKQFEWTAAQDRFLRENAAQGWGYCAEQLKRTATAIYNRVRRLKIQRRMLKAADLQKIRELHSQGKMTYEIGALLGVTDECVRRWLHLWNLPLHKRDEKKRIATFEERLLAKYGVGKVGQLRVLVERRRATELGYPGVPMEAALTIVALQRLRRTVDKYELARERAAIGKERKWCIANSWHQTLKGARRLREHGMISVSGGGNQLMRFSLLGEAA